MAGFDTWIDTFIEEKGLDLEHRFDVEGPEWGSNSIPLSAVVAFAKHCSPGEQAQIKSKLVEIDYRNGDVIHFFEHMAKGNGAMNIIDFAAAAADNGWTEAASDVDIFGHYRSASWRNPQRDQIIHAATVGDRTRPNIIASVEVSTTDELGWAASRIDAWSDSAGNLDGAVDHLVRN